MSLHSADLASGRISKGISPHASIDATIAFVASQLAAWRDDPARPGHSGEVSLNVALCKYLNRAAHRSFYMIEFCHDEPNTDGLRPDISVSSHEEVTIGATKYSLYDPFLWIEGKRLPTPDTRREKEYVVGTEKPLGGIQRFKLGLHGRSHFVAVLIGYIQDKDIAHWRDAVNKWIRDLAKGKTQDGCEWSHSETLRRPQISKAKRTGQFSSNHPRAKDKCDRPIRLVHLWVVM